MNEGLAGTAILDAHFRGPRYCTIGCATLRERLRLCARGLAAIHFRVHRAIAFFLILMLAFSHATATKAAFHPGDAEIGYVHGIEHEDDHHARIPAEEPDHATDHGIHTHVAGDVVPADTALLIPIRLGSGPLIAASVTELRSRRTVPLLQPPAA